MAPPLLPRQPCKWHLPLPDHLIWKTNSRSQIILIVLYFKTKFNITSLCTPEGKKREHIVNKDGGLNNTFIWPNQIKLASVLFSPLTESSPSLVLSLRQTSLGMQIRIQLLSGTKRQLSEDELRDKSNREECVASQKPDLGSQCFSTFSFKRMHLNNNEEEMTTVRSQI